MYESGSTRLLSDELLNSLFNSDDSVSPNHFMDHSSFNQSISHNTTNYHRDNSHDVPIIQVISPVFTSSNDVTPDVADVSDRVNTLSIYIGQTLMYA